MAEERWREVACEDRSPHLGASAGVRGLKPRLGAPSARAALKGGTELRPSGRVAAGAERVFQRAITVASTISVPCTTIGGTIRSFGDRPWRRRSSVASTIIRGVGELSVASMNCPWRRWIVRGVDGLSVASMIRPWPRRSSVAWLGLGYRERAVCREAAAGQVVRHGNEHAVRTGLGIRQIERHELDQCAVGTRHAARAPFESAGA
jgi:hypothetical protein